MITKELTANKMCLFCASDYHLEMILLPYIKEKIKEAKFVIFTQDNLEDTMKTLLNRVNFDDISKEEILKLDWKINKNGKIKKLEKYIKNNDDIVIIINGEYSYIKEINNNLKNYIYGKLNIIDCFHVGDLDVDIENLSKKYECILNTRKI